jgi:hypothetical protein
MPIKILFEQGCFRIVEFENGDFEIQRDVEGMGWMCFRPYPGLGIYNQVSVE